MTNKVYKSFTNILYPKKNALTGVMNTLNLFGISTSYNISHSDVEVDRKALLADWTTTGNDLRNAIENARKQYR